MKKIAAITGIFSLLVLVSCSSKSEIIPLRGALETSLGKLERVEKRGEIKISVDEKEKTIRSQNNETLYIFIFSGKNEISKGEDGFPLIDSAWNFYLPVFEGTSGTDGILSNKGWILNGELLGREGKFVFVGTIKLPRPQITLIYLIPKSVQDLAFVDAIKNGEVHSIIGKAGTDLTDFSRAEKTFKNYNDAVRKGNIEESAECLTSESENRFQNSLEIYKTAMLERNQVNWLDNIKNMHRNFSSKMEYTVFGRKRISKTEIKLLIRTEFFQDASKTQSDGDETDWRLFKFESNEWKLEDPYIFLRKARKKIEGGVEGGIDGGVIGGVRGGVIDNNRQQKNDSTAIRIAPNQCPKLIKKVSPVYSTSALNDRIQGVVLLDILIDTSGRVQNARVLSGHPLLHDAAISAVKQWEYEPYKLEGKPKSAQFSVTVTFSSTNE
jgi:TonB family protein